jgi:hypothetical protein
VIVSVHTTSYIAGPIMLALDSLRFYPTGPWLVLTSAASLTGGWQAKLILAGSHWI